MKYVMNKKGFEGEMGYNILKTSSDSAYGYRPFELLVTSIAGCSGGVFRKILNKQRVNFTNITMDVDVERNANKANRIEKIKFHFVVTGFHLNQNKIEKSLETSKRNCAMVQSVIDSIIIEESVELIHL